MPCGAYVGTHKHGGKPLGNLANKELRSCRLKAHASFDPLWKKKHMTRSEAYSFLSKEMGIKKNWCHIAMFNVEQCKRVVEISKKRTNQIIKQRTNKFLTKFSRNK